MNFIKASSLTTIATIFKILSGIVLNKMLAIFVGPSGIAIIGQLQNFTQIASTIAQLGINTGVTKYVSEYKREDLKVHKVLNAATRITIVATIVVSFGTVIFSKQLSIILMEDSRYQYIFYVFSLNLFLFVLNNLYISYINGKRDIRQFFIISVIQSSISVLITSLLVYCFGLSGALIALVLNQSIIFIFIIPFIKDDKNLVVDNFFAKIDSYVVHNLLKYGIAGLVTVFCGPLILILIREEIINQVGIDTAGHWQAVWYISSTYLLFVSTIISVYFFPKFSEIQDLSILNKELVKALVLVFSLVAILSILIYLVRDYIIGILFSESFYQARDLFLFQVMGDVIRSLCLIFSYLFLSRARTKSFIFLEIFSGIGLFILCSIFLPIYGAQGITLGYFINSVMLLFCFLIFYYFSFKKCT